MRRVRVAAIILVGLIALASVVGGFLPRFNYAAQDREQIDAGVSRQHWLGTDELGRDRFSRILEGTRVSLLLAPAAAAISMLLAAVVGGASGWHGGLAERVAKAVIDWLLSVPWLFLLLMVRALLPLNTSPVVSAVVTFLLLGTLGWAASARVLQARASRLRRSQFMLLARAGGAGGQRLFWRHILPNLRPVLTAQFWLSVPMFILAEANLSLLGLGVAEPLPSLGSLLREMESALTLGSDGLRFAGLLVLIVVVCGLQLAVAQPEAC